MILAALGVGQMGLGLALPDDRSAADPARPGGDHLPAARGRPRAALGLARVLDERPSAATLAGGAIVVAAVVVQAVGVPGSRAVTSEAHV